MKNIEQWYSHDIYSLNDIRYVVGNKMTATIVNDSVDCVSLPSLLYWEKILQIYVYYHVRFIKDRNKIEYDYLYSSHTNTIWFAQL